MNVETTEHYEIRIRPNRSWIKFDWRALVEYKDLLFLLVRRDFVSKYKQTVLGPAWFVLQPLLMTLIFTVVFGEVAKIPTGGPPSTLFYLCGLLAWGYLAQIFSTTSSTFVTNASLFGKVYFPRLVVPLASVLASLFSFGIQLATFAVFFAIYKLNPSTAHLFGVQWQIIFLPLIILQIAAISLGVGLWMSALTAKYRDFFHLSAFIIQIWMYGTPVIYPFSQLPHRLQWIVLLNPMTMPVEGFRYMFLGAGTVSPFYLGVSIVSTLALLISGMMLFQKVERTFVDTV